MKKTIPYVNAAGKSGYRIVERKPIKKTWTEWIKAIITLMF